MVASQFSGQCFPTLRFKKMGFGSVGWKWKCITGIQRQKTTHTDARNGEGERCVWEGNFSWPHIQYTLRNLFHNVLSLRELLFFMSRSGNRLDCKWSVYLIPLLTTKCRSLSHLKKRGHCVYERFVPAETSYLGLIIGLLGQTLMKPRVVHHWVIIYNQKLTANTMLYSIHLSSFLVGCVIEDVKM